MFDLVADCNRYPEFLPFCTRAIGTPVSENELHGTLFINKGPFRKSFTTHNTMYRDAQPARIDIKLVNGPFKQLEGEWRFEETNDGCQVTLDLAYDMKSGLLNNALSSVFEWIAKSMVEAFCVESEKAYGKKPLPPR
ncbi:MAG: type II toxin-antitoxin system RatA family toxin [Gammaproteobacteria bacterium]|nr:type II toxin-antitoxin system RatA family toxin [Gammaproteobacteria bacterium]